MYTDDDAARDFKAGQYAPLSAAAVQIADSYTGQYAKGYKGRPALDGATTLEFSAAALSAATKALQAWNPEAGPFIKTIGKAVNQALDKEWTRRRGVLVHSYHNPIPGTDGLTYEDALGQTFEEDAPSLIATSRYEPGEMDPVQYSQDVLNQFLRHGNNQPDYQRAYKLVTAVKPYTTVTLATYVSHCRRAGDYSPEEQQAFRREIQNARDFLDAFATQFATVPPEPAEPDLTVHVPPIPAALGGTFTIEEDGHRIEIAMITDPATLAKLPRGPGIATTRAGRAKLWRKFKPLAERFKGFPEYFDLVLLRIKRPFWTTAAHHKGTIDRVRAQLRDMDPEEVALIRAAEAARDEETRIRSSNQPWTSKRIKATEAVREAQQALTDYHARKSLK